jgi:hypothetical protein
MPYNCRNGIHLVKSEAPPAVRPWRGLSVTASRLSNSHFCQRRICLRHDISRVTRRISCRWIKNGFMPVLLLFSFLSALAGAQMPDSAEKAKVRSVISEVENISRECDTLDEFGRKTIAQGNEMLAIGSSAVYTLSSCLNNTDWKVRFWIADMLGYLDNKDAKRPLSRLINDKKENVKVRNQAENSLKRLETPIERNIE